MIKKILIKKNKIINRNKIGIMVGIFGIISNLILGIIKLVIGFISNSVSIITDASNSIFDTFSSFITVVGFKLSNKNPTKKHPYGYARYEYLAGFIISFFMLIMGIIFFIESLNKIINPDNLVINNITYIILLIVIIIKCFQLYIYNTFSKIIVSDTLKTNSVESRNDIINTSMILLSMLVMKKFSINIDGYLGILVSLCITYSGIKMLIEEVDLIIGVAPKDNKINMIKNKLLSYKYVLGFHNLIIHNYGFNNDFVTVHIEINADIDTLTTSKIINKIEDDFKRNMNINLTIHIDPVIVKNTF